MSGQDALDALKAVGVVVGALSALLGFTTKWWVPTWRSWGDQRKARAAMPAMLCSLAAEFREHRDFVDHELRPNNSSSIRDAIDRIERTGAATSNEVRTVVGMIRHGQDGNSREGIFETGPDGLTVWVNTTFLRWTGLQLAECIGWGWINAVAHNDRERLRDEWETAIEERRAFSSTYRLLDASGQPFTIECKANPIRDASGSVVKWMGTVIRKVDLHPVSPSAYPPEASFT